MFGNTSTVSDARKPKKVFDKKNIGNAKVFEKVFKSEKVSGDNFRFSKGALGFLRIRLRVSGPIFRKPIGFRILGNPEGIFRNLT